MSGTVTVSGGYVPGATDVLTTSKLNRMVSEFQARVGEGEIGTRELEDGSIPLSKLDADVQAGVGVADGAVSTAKLADGAFASSGTGRAKMENGFVTAAKLGDGAIGTDALGAGAVTAGKLASGLSIANVAMGTVTTASTLGSGSWVATGLSVAITPARTTSKVLVLVHASVANSAAAYGVFLRVKRNGSVLSVGDAAGSRTQCMGVAHFSSGAYAPLNGDLVFLDSPGSVAALTYTVEAYAFSGSLLMNRGRTDTDSSGFARGASSIVVMELLG